MMTSKRLLALYGLKYMPFVPNIPDEAIHLTPRTEHFCQRVVANVHEGGFAVCTGEPGAGKSVIARVLAQRLAAIEGVKVGCIAHPQSKVSDFYRELGELFALDMNVYNRFAGFRSLRDRWVEHIAATMTRPVLLIDEAQEMASNSLTELRILCSKDFDAQCLLTVVFFGDGRLTDRFRSPELLPLATRIRTRLVLEPASREELRGYLEHRLAMAGAPHLMTPELVVTLCERAAGNPRTLLNMASELLQAGAERGVERLDEKLFLEVFSVPTAKVRAAPLTAPAKAKLTSTPSRLA